MNIFILLTLINYSFYDANTVATKSKINTNYNKLNNTHCPNYIGKENCISLKGIINQNKLLIPSESDGDNFGISVSYSGNRALVGAYKDDDKGQDAGAVYIFELIEGNWTKTKLTASDGSSGDYFGYSVSLSGTRALVGAYLHTDTGFGAQSGAAYVYDLIGGNWVETKVPSTQLFSQDNFGFSVSLQGDRMLIGAPNREDFLNRLVGVVYSYNLIAGVWEETELVKSFLSTGGFGRVVSLSGDRVLVGASGAENPNTFVNTGVVYIYDLASSTWLDPLLASDGEVNDAFGFSVSQISSKILIGAVGDDDNALEAGSAYLFEFVNGTWEETKLLPTSGNMFDSFGVSVSLSADTILIGATGNIMNTSGYVYIFEKNNNSWIQSNEFNASDSNIGDNFGRSLSLAQNQILVGANRDDDSGVDSGSAYVVCLKTPCDLLYINGFE